MVRWRVQLNISYEVYICRYKNEIVYIGQGRYGRHKHCKSGCSHVYELNKIHFQDNKSKIVVDVHYGYTKEEAVEKEKYLIDQYKPRFNKVGVSDLRNTLGNRRRKFKEKCLEFIRTKSKSEYCRLSLIKSLDEYMLCHSDDDIFQNGINFLTAIKYETRGCVELPKFSKGLLKEQVMKSSKSFIFKMALKHAYEETY